MEQFLTQGNITFVIALMGVLFGVYHYFRNPQIDGDKKDALLAQQVQWQIEGSEKRFKDMQDSFATLVAQNQNHLHTIDTKVEALNKNVTALAIEVTRLHTIIEERIPRK